ncbi:MAG TPA: beta-glucosidase [Clostridiales bacterium]|nr:beta-glucosidase [Clostridiales bacterium]
MEDYKNVNLPPEERARDLLQRLTLSQKIGQLMCKMFTGDPKQTLEDYPDGVGEVLSASMAQTPEDIASVNRRIIDAVMEKTGGIPPVLQAEAVSGLISPGATSFPSAIGLAATFNTPAVFEMTGIIQEQMRSVGIRRACSPVMDVARDPRWGRMGETYGEDPTLCAAMSTAFVKGLQGKELTEGVSATGKHFLGYAMGEGGYNSASNAISPRDLREAYAKPFQAAITDGDLQTVMNSYAAPDNEPVVASKSILTGLLREEMKFQGVTVSDYGSVIQLMEKRIESTREAAAARAFNAGMDIECQNPETYPCLYDAVKSGRVKEEQIDQAVLRILTLKFKMGLFENPYPHADLIPEVYRDASNEAQSIRLARESIVLLKNDGMLPLSKELDKIAVIGPRADSIRMMFGGYTAPAGLEMSMGGLLKGIGINMGGEAEEYYPNSSVKKESEQLEPMLEAMLGRITPTIFDAIAKKCPDTTVLYEKGCDIAGDDRSAFGAAIALASDSDAVIFAAGGKYGWGEPCTSGEGRDSTKIGLPGVQEELLKALCETGTPVVVVHGDTRPISSLYAKNHANAVLEAWCPGQTGGSAVADVIFGDYNPAGRLPVTALEHAGQIPMYASSKRGNLMTADQRNPGFNSFSNGIQEPLWYFGEGYSYTQFEYRDFMVDEETTAAGVIKASVTVTNTGNRPGEEVVQLYFTDEYASMLRPGLELAGFARIFIPAGESRKVMFTMRTDQTAFLDQDMRWVVEEGDITLKIAASSKDIRAERICRIKDSLVIDGTKRGFVADVDIQTV